MPNDATIDIVSAGVPPRTELNKMLACPPSSDVPRIWLDELLRASERIGSQRMAADDMPSSLAHSQF